MKKLKKLFATVSAVAMCAVSTTPFVSNAIGLLLSSKVTPYTVSFTVNNEKYFLYEEASDYGKFDEKDMEFYSYEDKNGNAVTCYDGGMNFYVSETGRGLIGFRYWYVRHEDGTTFFKSDTSPLGYGYYDWENEKEREMLESYLTDNNISYTVISCFDSTLDSIELKFDKGTTAYDEMKVYFDIKENTGLVCDWASPAESIQITDVENALPEKTLDGDANEDGKVDIADASAIIQHIGNPGKYGLTMQGMANADCYNMGDGVTGMDAIAIQKLEAGLIESFDEA